MKKEHTIIIAGCDDETNINLKLTRAEAKLIKKLSKLSIKEATYECMPTIHLDYLDREWI